uniref:Uncharacterized protein n=1 Tax=Romanomermis culicivorax TaxID=13658 RepID=A0A915KJC6_ROMCU
MAAVPYLNALKFDGPSRAIEMEWFLKVCKKMERVIHMVYWCIKNTCGQPIIKKMPVKGIEVPTLLEN